MEMIINGRPMAWEESGPLTPCRLLAQNLGLEWTEAAGVMAVGGREVALATEGVRLGGRVIPLDQGIPAMLAQMGEALGASVWALDQGLVVMGEHPHLNGVKIEVIPGHLGENTTEAHTNEDLAQKLVQLLRLSGAVPVERGEGDLCIHIHHNWAPDSQISGVEAYYYLDPLGQRLAYHLHQELFGELGRGRGVREAAFHSLKKATVPTCYVEVLFLSNPQEREKAQAQWSQVRLATAIWRGISAFLASISP